MSDSERDLSGSSPWSMYEDEDEPWKDFERLLRLNEKLDHQYEIAHALGTSGSTISYWLDKAKREELRDALRGGEICSRCEDEEVPGGDETANQLCETCVDELRHRDSNANYSNYREFLEDQ